MLKRKCHKYGQAIFVSYGLIMVCSCISAREIEMVMDAVKSSDGLPKGRLPKGHPRNVGLE